MEQLNEAKQLIGQSKNIYLIPSQNNEPESLCSTLAFFYTLREMGKNVNVIIEELPEKLNFLVPSLDFISFPQNLTIAIPRKMAEISQIYYEKTDDLLKINLAVDKGRVKKENISFYFSSPRPDLVITLGIKDLMPQLTGRLDSFGFLLDCPIINIDVERPASTHSQEELNKKFGKINLIGNKSLSESSFGVINFLSGDAAAAESPLIGGESAATCLLAGLVIGYENLKSSDVDPSLFDLISYLNKKGASWKTVVDKLSQTNQKEISFLGEILRNIKGEANFDVALLDSEEFGDFSEKEAASAVEKIKSIGINNNLLVLWKSHNSEPSVKGFFFSKDRSLISRISQGTKRYATGDWVFISGEGGNINLVKENIEKLL